MTNEVIIDNFINDVEKLYNQRVGDAEDGFGREFQKLKQQSQILSQNPQYKTTAGTHVDNKKKSRYKDVLPFDHSRVKLPKSDGYSSDFINASIIQGPDGRQSYIASQGPLPQTTNDFWRMLWSYKVKVIVMVCREVELGKQKCERYWAADENDIQIFGDIAVTLSAVEKTPKGYCKRTLCAKRGKETRTLFQFHYTAWPDHGVPRTRDEIISMIEAARSLQDYRYDATSPLCVHCSAGCGRTGAVLVIDYFRNLLLQKKLTADVRVFDVVSLMRTQRPAIVQTKDQYEFVQLAVSELFTKHMKEKGKLLNSKLSKALTSTSYENVEIKLKEPPKESKPKPQEINKPAVTMRNNYENVELDRTVFPIQPNNRRKGDRSSRPVSSFEPLDHGANNHNYRGKDVVSRKKSDPEPNASIENHSFLVASMELISKPRSVVDLKALAKSQQNARSSESSAVRSELNAGSKLRNSNLSAQNPIYATPNKAEPSNSHKHAPPAADMPPIPERTDDSFVLAPAAIPERTLECYELSPIDVDPLSKPEKLNESPKSAEFASETNEGESNTGAVTKSKRFFNWIGGSNNKEEPSTSPQQSNAPDPKPRKTFGFPHRLARKPKGAKSKPAPREVK